MTHHIVSPLRKAACFLGGLVSLLAVSLAGAGASAQESPAPAPHGVVAPDGLRPPKPEGGAPPLLTLREALVEAARRNEDVRVAAQRIVQAEAMRDRAWAAFKPNLRAQGSFTHHDQEVSFGNNTIVKQNELAGSVTASLQVVNLRAIKSIQASYDALAAAEADADAVRRSILYETARTYYSAAAARKLVEVAERNIDKAQVTLRTAQDKLEAGVSIPIDVSRARLSLLQAQKELVTAQSTVGSLLEVLRFLTDVDGAYRVEASPGGVAIPGRATVEEAVAARPDIAAAASRLMAADNQATGALFEALPKLSVSFNYQASENTGVSDDVDQWDIRIVLEWLLYDGGARYADLQEADAERLISELSLSRARRGVTRDARQLALSLQAASVNHSMSVEQRDVAEQQYELVHARADAGLADSLEVSEADAALFNAEAEIVRQALERDLAAVDLLESIGTEPFVIVGGK